MKANIAFSFLIILFPFFSRAATFEAPPDSVVRRLYDLVTFPKGNTPDWDEVRSLFLEEAVIVLRSSRTEMSVFSLDGFIQDFVRFIDRAKVTETGFQETITSLKVIELGDIAQCFVIYEAWIPGSERPPQQGVDSFQLVRKDGAWRIVSIINEIPGPGREIPDEIKN